MHVHFNRLESRPGCMTHHIICVYLAFRMMLLVMKCLSPLLGLAPWLSSSGPRRIWSGTGDPASQPGSIVLSSPDLSNCHSGLVTDNWQYRERRETRAHNNIQIHISIVRLQIGRYGPCQARTWCPAGVKYHVSVSLVRHEMLVTHFYAGHSPIPE